MTSGDPITKMTFKVKSAFPPKTQPNQYGEYTIQNITAEDETGTIQVGFFDAAHDLRQFIGQEITVTSGRNGKGAFSGICLPEIETMMQKYESSTKTGNSTRIA